MGAWMENNDVEIILQSHSVTRLGCLSFTVQNDVLQSLTLKCSFLHPSAESGKFLLSSPKM